MNHIRNEFAHVLYNMRKQIVHVILHMCKVFMHVVQHMRISRAHVMCNRHYTFLNALLVEVLAAVEEEVSVVPAQRMKNSSIRQCLDKHCRFTEIWGIIVRYVNAWINIVDCTIHVFHFKLPFQLCLQLINVFFALSKNQYVINI